MRVLGWGGTVVAFCFVSVEQCVFISDVVFLFLGCLLHIRIHQGSVEGDGGGGGLWC